MKLIKLSDTRYIIVDNSTIKLGDYYYNKHYNKQLNDVFRGSGFDKEDKKVIATTEETSNCKQLSLSEVEEAIYGYSLDKMADEYSLKVNKGNCDDLYPNCGLTLYEISYDDYKAGFNAHKELVKDKLFTVDDLYAFAKFVDRTKPSYAKQKEFIQSLLPKTVWNVEFDQNGKLKLI